MLWGAFHALGKSQMVVVDGTVNQQWYIAILRQNVILCARATLQRIFMLVNDNATPYTARNTRTFLVGEEVEVMQRCEPGRKKVQDIPKWCLSCLAEISRYRASTLGQLDKYAEGPRHIKRTGISFRLLGHSDEALPAPYKKWLEALHRDTDFSPNCQKPTPQQWVKLSTSICWLNPHTPSSCSQEGVCQGTPELVSSSFAPCAFHRWKLFQLKSIQRMRKGLEKNRGTLSGMQHRPAPHVRWWVSNCLGRHFPRCTASMCLIVVIWQVQGTETRFLDLMLGPTHVQSALGFSCYTPMADLMWQECANDFYRGWGHWITARCLYLNPIEHLWDIMDQRIRRLPNPPRSLWMHVMNYCLLFTNPLS